MKRTNKTVVLLPTATSCRHWTANSTNVRRRQCSFITTTTAILTFMVSFIINCAIVVEAFHIPLPGGGKISMDQGGILRISLEDTSKLPTVPPENTQPSSTTLASVQVRDTNTSKGYGAFATKEISKDTFLGFYEGTLISSREELDKKYSSPLTENSNMDYVMSLDGGMTFLDGYERAQDKTSGFSPVFLNHADKENDSSSSSSSGKCNCIRILKEQRVAFFTSRQIQVGEELCFDYGKEYWKGNEKRKI